MLTTFNDVTVTLDGTGTLSTNKWATLTNSDLTITGGSYSFLILADLDTSNLDVQANASLALPALFNYTLRNNFATTTFQASGVNGVLSLPNLTSIAAQATYPLQVQVQASSGGEVSMPMLSQISACLQVQSTGAGSVIDLSALQDFSSQLNVHSDPGTLTVTDQGAILDPVLTTLKNVSVTVDGPGSVLQLPVLTTFTGDTLTVSDGGYLEFGTTIVSMPSSGTRSLINVPQLPQEIPLNLGTSGTLTDATFNIPQGDNVELTGGTYVGAVFNIAQGDNVELTGGTYVGAVFNVGQGAVLDLTGGQTVTYSGTLTGSGSGTIQFSGGTFTVGVGGVTLDFPENLFQWTDGAMELTGGDATNLGTINLSGSNQTQIYADGTLFDYGTIIQSGTGNFGLHSDNVTPTTLMIEPGGSYLIESDAGINNLYNTNVIDNAGTIREDRRHRY